MTTTPRLTAADVAAAIEDAYGVTFDPRHVVIERSGMVYVGSLYAGTVRGAAFVADSRNWGGAK